MTKWTDEQLEAINKSGSNIIVSAGAGSGKTAVLTERVITKLKNGVHLNELLILTFTNNAAHEMKDRIKAAIMKEDSLASELNYIESANITTFDAYVLTLVKKYHYYLKIDKNINIIDASIIKEKKKEIIDKLFLDYYENNDETFIKLVTNFGVKNDKPIKKDILSLNDTTDLIINKDDYLNSYIDNYYSTLNINKLFDEYLYNIIKRIDTLKAILYNLSFELDGDVYGEIEDAIKPLLDSKNYDEIKSNSFFELRRLPNGSSDKAKYYKNELKTIKEEIIKMCTYNKDDLINDLMNTKEYSKIYIDILIKLNKLINEYKLKYNMFEFNDISMFAIKLLKENEDVRLELKNSFKEIMIDEYQDTSDIQETFVNLIENNNVYMVGDIKQSIYRFRNANPDIFKIKYDKYRNNNGGIKIDLNKNFRSRDGVLSSINKIFDHVMDDIIGNANYKLEHQLIFGNTSYIEQGNNNYNNNLSIYNYEADDKHSKEEIEAFIIGNDIKKKIKDNYLVFDKELRPCTYKDFCILMDRTGAFDIYKKVFDYLKIPLNIYKDEDLLLSDETYLIKNILGLIINLKKYIMDESTKFYFTSIARSYLYELDDNYIYDIIINNKIKETDIFIKCLEISKIIDISSNKEILELIIDKFNFYEKMISVGDISHRTIVLNNLINKGEDLNKIETDIYGMNDYFDSLISDKESIKLPGIIKDEDLVTITNIHKSKGLEYKVCYYSGLHKEFNMMDIKNRILFTNSYGLILPSYNEGFKATFVSYLNKEKYIREEISEKLRLFYVALTRAKEKMIIVTSLKEKDNVTYDENEVLDYLERINLKSFNDVLSCSKKYIIDYVENIECPRIDDNYKYKKDFNLDDFKENGNIIKVNELNDLSNIINEEHYSKSNKKLFSKDEKDNMEYGTKIHATLEYFDFKNPDYSLLDSNEKNIVSSLLENDIMRNIKDAKIFKEYEFINEDEISIRTGIIDLMLVYNDHIDIIDYKLKHTDDEAYNKQLNGYKDYINNKTNKDTNIYLYSLLDRRLIKID